MAEVTEANWIKPIQRQNLSELAYVNLRDALMQGQMKPGEELPLRPISRSFGISATPMREALLRLVTESALEMDSRGRISVPHLTRAALMLACHSAMYRFQEVGEPNKPAKGEK